MQDKHFTINGERFVLGEDMRSDDLWLEHLDSRGAAIDQLGPFRCEAAAQQAAMEYVREFERAQAEAWEDARENEAAWRVDEYRNRYEETAA